MADTSSGDGDNGFSSSGGIMLMACGSSNIAATDWGGPEEEEDGWVPEEDGGGSPPSLLSGRLPAIFGWKFREHFFILVCSAWHPVSCDVLFCNLFEPPSKGNLKKPDIEGQ